MRIAMAYIEEWLVFETKDDADKYIKELCEYATNEQKKAPFIKEEFQERDTYNVIIDLPYKDYYGGW